MSSEMEKALAKLKENYVQALPEKIAAVRTHWQALCETKNIDDIEQLHRMAHSLAGSGATFDQIEVSKAAKDLENHIKDNALDNEIFDEKHVNAIEEYLLCLESSISDGNGSHTEKSEGDEKIDIAKKIANTLATMKVDPMSILLADDDSDFRNHIKVFLESRGHEVFEAKTGREAIEIFEMITPDIIIIGIVMPEITGYEATKIIKEKSINKFIPVIFLTSNSDDETLARCISAGGDDFLTKPVNPIILNAKLQSFQRIRAMYAKLDEYQQKTEEELETSKHVFDSLVNNANDNIDGLSCWADSPGHFSGDTQLFKIMENGHIIVLLCDFTGHGLPAAIGTVFAADLFRSMTKKGCDAEVILNEINLKMNQILPTGRYCAAVMLDFDPSVSRVKIWNAGLPNAYLLDENNQITQDFPSSGVPLGVLSGDAQCDFVEVDVTNSRSIVIFSDGITEAENAAGEMYLEPRLLKCFTQSTKEKNIFDVIKRDVEKFMNGVSPTDDISLVVLDLNKAQG